MLDVWVGEQWDGIVKEKDLDCITSAVFRKLGLAAWLPVVVRTEPAMCVCLCVVVRAGVQAGGGGITIWFLLVQILKAHICLPYASDESPLQPEEQRSDVQRSSWKRETSGDFTVAWVVAIETLL